MQEKAIRTRGIYENRCFFFSNKECNMYTRLAPTSRNENEEKKATTNNISPSFGLGRTSWVFNRIRGREKNAGGRNTSHVTPRYVVRADSMHPPRHARILPPTTTTNTPRFSDREKETEHETKNTQKDVDKDAKNRDTSYTVLQKRKKKITHRRRKARKQKNKTAKKIKYISESPRALVLLDTFFSRLFLVVRNRCNCFFAEIKNYTVFPINQNIDLLIENI